MNYLMMRQMMAEKITTEDKVKQGQRCKSIIPTYQKYGLWIQVLPAMTQI